MKPGRKPRPVVAGRLRCSTCSEWKAVDDYHRSAARPHGVKNECKTCTASYKKSWLYGGTFILEEWLEKQGGGCAICGAPSAGGRWDTWNVDHDHTCCPTTPTCGKCTRGVLCFNCNYKLVGQIESENGAKALKYLSNWKEECK